MDNRADRRRDPLTDDGIDRERLLGWPRIVVLGVVIVTAMVLLYPRDRLVEKVSQSDSQDTLTRSYLDNLLKNDPENPGLLIRRARSQIEAGEEEEAESLLLTLASRNDAGVRIEAAEALIELRERQLFAQAPGSEERQKRLATLHRAFAALDEMPLDSRRRAELARKASVHGAEALALMIYRRLAEEAAGEQAVAWLEEGARTAQTVGQYSEAAGLYFDARRRSSQAERRTAYYLAGVRALQAGNMPLEALAAAEAELGDLGDDAEILLFIVRLARSADRNDRAEVYVRKLLRYALGGGPARIRRVVAQSVAPVTRSDSLLLSRRIPGCFRDEGSGMCWKRLPGVQPMPAAGPIRNVSHGPLLPFDDEIYLQGYEVFLANRKLRDAHAVAEAAVRQAPDNVAWRQRLARVAEWNGKPEIALEQWRRLALTHDGDEAWQAVLRLAPGLFDEESVVLALTREHRLGRLDDARLIRLVEAFDALGEPQRGIDFLREAYRATPRRLVLARQAWLEERSGRIDQAAITFRQIEQTYGLQMDEVLRLAGMLVTRAKLGEAYALLQQYGNARGNRDREYLELMAELSWRLQDRSGARDLYQALYGRGALEDYQVERLILIMRDDSPGAAADLASRQWEERRAPRLLALAVELHLHNVNAHAARALLAGLSSSETAASEKQPGFLRLRADVKRKTGDMSGAIADIRRALKRTPGDVGLHAHLLWLLVEARERTQLATELRRRHPGALDEPDLWGAMAAGYVLSGKPAQALAYFAKQAVSRRDDYLWLANYAQVLEDAGQADMAWRLRRHAWLNLRPADSTGSKNIGSLRVTTQLALRSAPGDAGASWLRELLRQDVDGEAQLSPQAKELATAWFLTNEKFESARLWLAQQYGKQLEAPRWAEVAMALQSNDRAELRRIVDGEGGEVAMASRVEAAMQLGDHVAARRLATAGLETKPDDNTLHLKLTESLWQRQDRVTLSYRDEKLGALRGEGWRVDVQWHPASQLRLSLEISRDRLSSRNPEQLAHLPAHDSRVALSGTLTHDLGDTGFKLFHRDAQNAFAGAELNHRFRIDRRFLVGGLIGYNLDADENAALKAAGAKDVFKLNGEWLISRREYLLLDVSTGRYYDQWRGYLGHGRGVALQLGHHVRTEYPNATLKLMAGSYQFTERTDGGTAVRGFLPSAAAVLPESFHQVGLGVDLGTVASEQYSRALRPYGSLDLLHGSRGGWGYGLGLGFVFSPTGNDWLRGRYRDGRSRFNSSEDASLLEFEYRYLF